MRRRIVRIGSLAGLLGLALSLGIGCAGLVRPRGPYDYFSLPDPTDPWSRKIAGWQRRELADVPASDPATPAVAGGGESGRAAAPAVLPGMPAPGLRAKYSEFRAMRKRSLARSTAEWIQEQAQAHYMADGPVDHWATLEETLRRDGDDCDGLELLVYHALRDLGFSEREVYRAIVYRPSDGQHHMVTLWFEDPDDPWVLDPTGAMTTGMPRMSDLPAWVPLKVFSDASEYTVRPRTVPGLADALAAAP